MSQKYENKFDPTLALDIAFVIVVAGFIGARVFHVFYEEFDYYRQYPMDVFKFWQGGFVFFGGFILAMVSMAVMLRYKGESFLRWADFLAPVLSIGYSVGRIGCFMGGCCYGKQCDLPWSVEFTYPNAPQGPRHPTQLYASFWEAAVFSGLLFLEHRLNIERSPKYTGKKLVPTFLHARGSVLFVWLLFHGIGRLIMELFRDDDRGAAYMNISISGWISIALISISFFMLWIRRKEA